LLYSGFAWDTDEKPRSSSALDWGEMTNPNKYLDSRSADPPARSKCVGMIRGKHLNYIGKKDGKK
jgi:hypothetical protein